MADLPPEVVDEAARLTRLARRVVDDAEATVYRDERESILAERGYVARVRSDTDGPVLVCYPTDWISDGVVDPSTIDELDRAVERPLSGPAEPDDWPAVDAHNRAIATTVETAHGPVHGATAHAFADFMGNHYASRLERADSWECREFLVEYLPRNAWPTAKQRWLAPVTLRLVFEAAHTDPPPIAQNERA